jgi:hypothetical protein
VQIYEDTEKSGRHSHNEFDVLQLDNGEYRFFHDKVDPKIPPQLAQGDFLNIKLIKPYDLSKWRIASLQKQDGTVLIDEKKVIAELREDDNNIAPYILLGISLIIFAVKHHTRTVSFDERPRNNFF